MAKINPLTSGLVRIQEQKKPAEAEVSAKTTEPVQLTINGELLVDLSAPVTAENLAVQISQLGIEKVSVERLRAIAGRDADQEFDYGELAALDQYLEQLSSNDKDFCLAAVKKNGLMLQYVSESLRASFEICMAAVKENGLAFKYIFRPGLSYLGTNFGNDAINKLAVSAIAQLEAAGDHAAKVRFAADSPFCLGKEFPPSWLEDREIMLAAFSSRAGGIYYLFLSDDMKNEPEVALLALEHRLLLEHVPEALHDDPRCVLTAVSRSVANFPGASDRL